MECDVFNGFSSVMHVMPLAVRSVVRRFFSALKLRRIVWNQDTGETKRVESNYVWKKYNMQIELRNLLPLYCHLMHIYTVYTYIFVRCQKHCFAVIWDLYWKYPCGVIDELNDATRATKWLKDPRKKCNAKISEKAWVQGTSKDPSLAFAPASRVWWHPRRTQSNQWEMHTVDMSIFGIIALAVSGTLLSTKIHGRTNPPHHDGETKWSYIVCFLNQWPFSRDQEMICGWSVDDLWMIINLRCRNRLFNCSSTYA